MKTSRKSNKEYRGYHWRVEHRNSFNGIFEWDADLVDLVLRVCPIPDGGSVLDLGCAGGDQAKLFAERGYQVTGVDYVKALIAYAKNTFSEHGLTGDFVVGDMREIVYEDRFDLCVLLSGAFGYFSDIGNHDLLVRILRVIKVGGYAFVDYNSAEYWARRERSRDWLEFAGGITLTEFWFDVPTSTCRGSYKSVLPDGEVVEFAGDDGNSFEVIRCYGAREIENLAERVGFELVEHLTMDHITNPTYQADFSDPRKMIVLRKPAR